MNEYDEQSDYQVGMEILGENVDRGEIFLDSVDPEWYKKVNLPRLTMEDGNACICGWVFKEQSRDGYSYFVTQFEDEGDGDEYGFMPWHEDDMPDMLDSEQQWSMLAELWTVKVEKRLAQDGLLS